MLQATTWAVVTGLMRLYVVAGHLNVGRCCCGASQVRGAAEIIALTGSYPRSRARPGKIQGEVLRLCWAVNSVLASSDRAMWRPRLFLVMGTGLKRGSPEPFRQSRATSGGRGRGPLYCDRLGVLVPFQPDRRIKACGSSKGRKPPMASAAAGRQGRQDNSSGSMPRSGFERRT